MIFLSDVLWFLFCIFIWARPFGSGFYGLRFASEHPTDGSPSGPAYPSRNFILRLKYIFDDAIQARAASGSLHSVAFGEKTLRIPRANILNEIILVL